jgi:hypothetical protein
MRVLLVAFFTFWWGKKAFLLLQKVFLGIKVEN